MNWGPVLADCDREVACRKIHEIAEILYTRDFSENGPGLMEGNMGIALFLYYYSAWSDKEAYYEKASELLGASLEKMVPLFDKDPLAIRSSFYDGISGIGWGLLHLLQQEIVEGGIEYWMGELEAVLYRRMIYDLQRSDIGLLRGAVGTGIYGVGRSGLLVQEYFRRFATELHRKVFEERAYEVPADSSIGDGVCGLLLLLRQIGLRYGGMEYVDGLKAYLLGQLAKTAPEPAGGLRGFGDRQPGWNQRDAGILFTLLKCSEQREKVLETLSKYAAYTRRVCEGTVFDSGLFGGFVSAGHLFNRIYHETGQDVFRDTAVSLIRQGIGQASFAVPDAGYGMWLTECNGVYGLHRGLGGGLSGIGLALIAAVSDIEPAWDGCLLLS